MGDFQRNGHSVPDEQRVIQAKPAKPSLAVDPRRTFLSFGHIERTSAHVLDGRASQGQLDPVMAAPGRRDR